nr:MAG TPA: hypothetical protein [Caudoviricetes sp.]
MRAATRRGNGCDLVDASTCVASCFSTELIVISEFIFKFVDADRLAEASGRG